MLHGDQKQLLQLGAVSDMVVLTYPEIASSGATGAAAVIVSKQYFSDFPPLAHLRMFLGEFYGRTSEMFFELNCDE